MNKILLVGIMSITVIGCSTRGEGYMQQQELLAQIQQGQTPVIVDVRSEFEYQTSHVPGAIHVPFWAAFTTDKLDSIDKTNPVVLYCAHGPRAGIAKLALSLSGFDDIRYLAGHMSGWSAAGLPVEPEKE